MVKPREAITSSLEWIRVAQLSPDADTADTNLSAWVPTSFITESYKLWWEEWKEQLFTVSVHMYRKMIDPEHEIPEDVVISLPILNSFFTSNFIGNSLLHFNQVDDPAPSMSRSGRPFNPHPVSPVSLISHNAPSLVVLMHRGVCFKKMMTKRSKTTPSVVAATLAQAFKVKTLN